MMKHPSLAFSLSPFLFLFFLGDWTVWGPDYLSRSWEYKVRVQASNVPSTNLESQYRIVASVTPVQGHERLSGPNSSPCGACSGFAHHGSDCYQKYQLPESYPFCAKRGATPVQAHSCGVFQDLRTLPAGAYLTASKRDPLHSRDEVRVIPTKAHAHLPQGSAQNGRAYQYEASHQTDTIDDGDHAD
ncbi:hypothetical protein BBK36DRAFT_1189207 [Trichoderma citrinoviride]|uniref:Uncharacterized protein n=1 Tax=Trichoderma citrinoviride TaxID=58853 RepID=A0A2T4BL04_9HYPO|nr:hypothetical protein BBK36DRAFT_1189207 [Trichoderma citrinoviride]PTB70004.1 hypothetical protein BBK36DRAFT_1189207 [Trichoderma citrinoviride]